VSKIIVFFNLTDAASRSAYEDWARSTDLPVVRKLPSVDSFEVHRVTGLVGSDEAAPYDYVEIIDVNSMEQFGADVSTEVMGKVAGEFRSFTDNPVFMLTDNLDNG